MNIPTPPSRPATEVPDEWKTYFAKLKKYETYLRQKKYAAYRQRYYAKRTEERQKEKMKELIKKYPDEAKKIIMEMLQSK